MSDLKIETVKKYLKENTFEFNPTQNKICYPILNRLYKKLHIGVCFKEIKVEENEGLIIDGHHRFIASKIAEINIDTFPSLKTSATRIYTWFDIEIVENEWDTKERIEYLNELDAELNDLDINMLNSLIL